MAFISKNVGDSTTNVPVNVPICAGIGGEMCSYMPRFVLELPTIVSIYAQEISNFRLKISKYGHEKVIL